jgi:hypothetical protein
MLQLLCLLPRLLHRTDSREVCWVKSGNMAGVCRAACVLVKQEARGTGVNSKAGFSALSLTGLGH